MKKRIVALLLAVVMVASGCGNSDTGNQTKEEGTNATETKTEATTDVGSVDSSEMFSDRDFNVDYDESKSAMITLNGDSATCSSNAVKISGSTITIIDEGTYILSGTLNDGMIIVDSEKTDKTQLVLNGVTIHSETSAPIYILQSDKVFITMAEGTTNTLSNGGTFTAIDENNIDAVIFSKEDVTLNGYGTLVVTSPAGHGIVSKDSLTITSGSYDINCASHALCGKDDVSIANAEMTIVSGKDGIHAENDEDANGGLVYIQSGTFDITAEGDGVSASSHMKIEDCSFTIVSGGGSENGSKQTSDSWGGFSGGGRHQGGKGGDRNSNVTSAGTTDDDSTSIKGIKASADLVINGGTFTINSADDAFHADETLTIAAGDIQITESYEGLEGLHVALSGGNITLMASDDGINAAGGTDQSGMGGNRGGDQFGGRGGSSSSNGSITISGGQLMITAYGDGLDANGTLEITGGYTVVSGPTQGDTATLDYDISGTISGGTFIGTGSSMMAQTFSSSEQGVVAVSASGMSAGTTIVLTDSEGNVILEYTPELSYAVVILSSPDMISGENYTLTIGDVSKEFTAN